MSARETEDMVNSMLRDSPLPNTERSDEKLPKDDGSGKLLDAKLLGRLHNDSLATHISGIIYIGTTRW